MRRVVSALVLVVGLLAAVPARASYRVPVLVPDRVSMQYATFWVAFGGGFFSDEGYDVEVVVPPPSAALPHVWEQRVIDYAVLPATAYTAVLANRGDLALVADLFANDPANLVVRRSIVDRVELPTSAPIRNRLSSLRGVGIGVARDASARFRALYDVSGLDADRDAQMNPLEPGKQCAAFHDGKIDALFTESPCLERALVDDDAVMIVNQSGGELTPTARHVIVAFAVRPSMLETERPVAIGLLRALLHAARVIHDTPKEAVAILARQFPARDRRELDVILALYAPAIPVAPQFPISELARTANLFADERVIPDFAQVDLAHAVNYDVMGQAQEVVAPGHARNVMLSAAGIVLAVIAVGIFTKRRR